MKRGIIFLLLLTTTTVPVFAEDIAEISQEQTEGFKCDLRMRGYEFTNDGLSEAIVKQDTEAVELFVKADININLSDNEGYTALDRAIESHNETTVALICNAGGETKANLQKTEEKNISKPEETVKIETKTETATTTEDEVVLNGFCKAVNDGNYEEVEKTIKNTADLDVLTEEGLAPIHYAVFNDDNKMVEILLAEGADINNRTNDGLTALDITVLNGQKAIAKKLLENGGAMSEQVAEELRKFGCHMKYDVNFDLYDASFEDIFSTMDKIQKQIDANGNS